MTPEQSRASGASSVRSAAFNPATRAPPWEVGVRLDPMALLYPEEPDHGPRLARPERLLPLALIRDDDAEAGEGAS